MLVPEGFEPLDGVEGLFFYSPEEDVVYYFSYCEFSEEIDGFYPADENGTVAPGTLPVTLDEEGNVLVVLNIDGEIIYVNAVVNISADEENAGEGDAAEDDNNRTPRLAVVPLDQRQRRRRRQRRCRRRRQRRRRGQRQ